MRWVGLAPGQHLVQPVHRPSCQRGDGHSHGRLLCGVSHLLTALLPRDAPVHVTIHSFMFPVLARKPGGEMLAVLEHHIVVPLANACSGAHHDIQPAVPHQQWIVRDKLHTALGRAQEKPALGGPFETAASGSNPSYGVS